MFARDPEKTTKRNGDHPIISGGERGPDKSTSPWRTIGWIPATTRLGFGRDQPGRTPTNSRKEDHTPERELSYGKLFCKGRKQYHPVLPPKRGNTQEVFFGLPNPKSLHLSHLFDLYSDEDLVRGKFRVKEDSETFSPVSYWSSSESHRSQGEDKLRTRKGFLAPMEEDASVQSYSPGPSSCSPERAWQCGNLYICFEGGLWEIWENSTQSREIWQGSWSQGSRERMGSVGYLLKGECLKHIGSSHFGRVKPQYDSWKSWTRRRKFPVLHQPLAVHPGEYVNSLGPDQLFPTQHPFSSRLKDAFREAWKDVCQMIGKAARMFEYINHILYIACQAYGMVLDSAREKRSTSPGRTHQTSSTRRPTSFRVQSAQHSGSTFRKPEDLRSKISGKVPSTVSSGQKVSVRMEVEEHPKLKDDREVSIMETLFSLSSGGPRIQKLRQEMAEANRQATQKKACQRKTPTARPSAPGPSGSRSFGTMPSTVSSQTNTQVLLRTMANPQRMALGHKLASVQMFDGRWVTYRRITIKGVGIGY